MKFTSPTHSEERAGYEELSNLIVHETYTARARSDGFLSQTPRSHKCDPGVEPGRAPSTRLSQKARMLLSFQRPSRPVGKGIPSKGRSHRAEALGAGPSSLAPLGGGCAARVKTRCRCPAEAKYTHSPIPHVVRVGPRTSAGAHHEGRSLVVAGYPPVQPRCKGQVVQSGPPRWCPSSPSDS